MLLCWVVLILTRALAQDPCPHITITAIVDCTFHFTVSNHSCAFTTCIYDSAVNSQVDSKWETCYASCCPGMVVPSQSERAELQACLDEYSSTPTVCDS